MGREEMAAPLALRVVEGRVTLLHPLAPAALNDPHDLFLGLASGGQHWMEVWAPCLGRTRGHHGRADVGRPRLDGAEHPPPHAAGEAAPRALRPPGLTVEPCFTVAGVRAQRPGGSTRPLGAAPPAPPGSLLQGAVF